MKPISSDALRRMALKQGAQLSINGKSLNAARSKVDAPKRPSPAPAVAYMPEAPPAPIPETVKADSGIFETASAIDRYASATFLMNENTALLLQDVKKILDDVAKPAPEQQRPIKWVFTVKRDMRGLMEQIVATPVFD